MINRPWKRTVNTLVSVLVVAGALYSAFFFFSTVRALVAQTPLPFAERVVQASNPVEPNAPSSDASESEPVKVIEPAREKLDERINVLLLGIDQRGDEKGPWRTDTMILLSLDPINNTAAMLSIPRDLWTTIPGYGENRINTAHYTGDDKGYPGGGPALAKKTVWYALGLPVHNYVRINFAGFEQLIDTIGGLTIEVEEAIHDTEYPDGHYGVMEIYIPAGVQQMDGETTLQYARSRHGSSDFDRMARQQQVLLAARDKIMSLDIPLTRLPEILELLGDSVQTDLTLEEIILLSEAARKVERDDIHHAVIDNSMTTTVTTPKGWMVEVADWEKVRALVDELFPAPDPTAQPIPSLSKVQLASEDAKIILQNGTLTSDLAQKAAAALRAKGFAVVSYDNADRFDHTETLIVVYGDTPYTADALANALNVDSEAVLYKEDGTTEADILVILGRDYAQPVQTN